VAVCVARQSTHTANRSIHLPAAAPSLCLQLGIPQLGLLLCAPAAGILTCSSTISVCALAAAMTATVLLFHAAPSNDSGALGPPQAACEATDQTVQNFTSTGRCHHTAVCCASSLQSNSPSVHCSVAAHPPCNTFILGKADPTVRNVTTGRPCHHAAVPVSSGCMHACLAGGKPARLQPASLSIHWPMEMLTTSLSSKIYWWAFHEHSPAKYIGGQPIMNQGLLTCSTSAPRTSRRAAR
jgi:hypothetical protein